MVIIVRICRYSRIHTLVSRLADLIFSSNYRFGRFTEIVPIDRRAG